MYRLFASLVALIGNVVVFIRHQNDRIMGQAVAYPL